jgi:hypothetical protein
MAAPSRSQLEAYARQVAVKNGVDPDIFVRQIDQESGFSPTAHNPSGASGIAQLMPQYYPNVDTSDPYASLDAAAQTMGANVKKYDGDYAKALAAYNAGGGAVDKYGGVPPFAETQTYVTNILGAGGGKTMGQQQDGTDPNLAIDPALVDAAINGDTPGAAAPGFVPDGNVGTVGASSPAQTAPQGQMNGNDILQMIVDKIGPYASRVVLNPTTTAQDPLLGPTTGPTHAPTYRYTWANGKTLDVAALDSGAVVKGGTALATLSSGSSPAVREFPDKSLRQEDTSQPLGSPGRWVKIADAPAEKTTTPKTINTKGGTFENDGSGWALIPGTAPSGASLQIHTFGDGSLHSYDPQTGQWALVQERYVDPTEEAYKKALTASAEATTAKTVQSLRPVAVQAVIEAGQTIDAIAAAYQRGEITAKEMTDMGAQVHQGLAATLAGTTIFEQQKQAQDTQTQRANAASSFLQQRIQSASSLGSSLFNAATANGGILQPKGGGSWGIDPLQIANGEVNQMGGGQSTGDAAAAFLKAALSGGAPAGGMAPPSGAPAPSQFPTTREAVLAQYPHLATQAQPAAAAGQFVAPNNEANAGGGVVPLVTPAATPMPLSPRNQLIQAGG